MKNMLVEAARVSNLADTVDELTESGSFDTTSTDFAATANDAAMASDAPDNAIVPELEPLQLDDVAGQWDVVDDEEAIGSADNGPQQVAPAVDTSMAAPIVPVHVRYSPLICIALAVLSATLWLSYLRVSATHDAAALGASLVQSRQPISSDVANSVSASDRFAYIVTADETRVDAQ